MTHIIKNKLRPHPSKDKYKPAKPVKTGLGYASLLFLLY